MMSWGTKTYIRVPANRLNGAVVKVTGVTGEASADRVSVLQSIENLVGEGKLATFPQLLFTGLLICGVNRV